MPTFGLFMCLAFLAAYVVLDREIRRRKLNVDPYSVVAYVAIAGILGAKIWHMVDTPVDRLTWQNLQSFTAFIDWFRGGFAWFGGFVAGIATLLLLGRKYQVRLLTMLDLSSSAAAIGYGVGRIGCLISGDGDYGKPTNLPWGMAFPHGLVPTTQTCVQWGWPANCSVHPTPIYEFAAAMAIFWYIWLRGERSLKHPLAPGVITGEFLILFGLERFLVEFLRINPRVILGMSNAQFAALLTTIAGIILLVIARRQFPKSPAATKGPVQHGKEATGT